MILISCCAHIGMAGAVLLAEQRDVEVEVVGCAETKEWIGATGENANEAGRRANKRI